MQYEWPVTGHDEVLGRLEGDVRAERVAHAYLFSGPAQVGKYTTARAFAQLLQCHKGGLCQHCTDCRQITNHSHLDTVQMIDIQESLKVEGIREIIGYLSVSRQSRYKIIILKNIERMTPEAANALLKTLEEPAQGVVMVLTTGQSRQVLPTLISRCRLVSFRALSDNDLKAFLAEKYPERDQAQRDKVAAFSLGAPGKARQLLDDSELLGLYEKTYDMVQEFLRGAPIYKRFAFAEEIAQSEVKLQVFFDVCLHVLRSNLFGHYGLVTHQHASEISRHAPEALINLLKRVVDAQVLVQHNVNQRLTLENVLLDF